jgi:hypothetical protein
MYPIPSLTRNLLLLLLISSLVAATDFGQCFADYLNGTDPTGGVDHLGLPVTSPAQAVGLTYKFCMANCGTIPESFNWGKFAQVFSSWLLPWLALLSQLPFGSGNYEDDFLSG